MLMIYNSPNYYVVEFAADNGDHALSAGGYEIVDKTAGREIFLDGTLARQFREEVQKLIASEPSEDEVDEFLGQFDTFMTSPVVLH